MEAPTRQTAAPITSQPSGIRPSTAHSHPSDASRVEQADAANRHLFIEQRLVCANDLPQRMPTTAQESSSMSSLKPTAARPDAA